MDPGPPTGVRRQRHKTQTVLCRRRTESGDEIAAANYISLQMPFRYRFLGNNIFSYQDEKCRPSLDMNCLMTEHK